MLRKVGNERFHHEVSERTAKGNANNFCFLEKGERVSLISGYVGFEVSKHFTLKQSLNSLLWNHSLE